MENQKPRVQYPFLKGSEQHHDLKNNPGDKGDPDHTKDDLNNDKDDDSK